MGLWRLLWLRLREIPLVILALALSGCVAQKTVIVRLDPVGDSGVSGTVTMTAVGDGTHVVIDIQGLAPGSEARATMQANTCAMPSASFAALPALKADANGLARATGSVLFHGTEDVALAIMADGEHVIFIRGEQAVACGVIPKLAPAVAP
jgi:hypothetical protein